MSYCRAGGPDSDVYAYASGPRHFSIHCAGESYTESTLQGFRTRLEALQAAGYKVPACAFDRIDKELAQRARRKSKSSG